MILTPATPSGSAFTPIYYFPFNTDFTETVQGSTISRAAWAIDISTTNKKFGAGSARVKSVGQAMWLASSSYMDNGDGTYGFKQKDFTMEIWFYLSTDVTQDGNTHPLIDMRTTGSDLMPVLYIADLQGFGPEICYGSGLFNGYIDHYIRAGAYNYSCYAYSGSWHHAAVSRKAGVTKLFFNGNVVGSITDTRSYTASSAQITINNGFNGSYPMGNATYPAFFDDVFICYGAKYTDAFTPPTAPAM